MWVRNTSGLKEVKKNSKIKQIGKGLCSMGNKKQKQKLVRISPIEQEIINFQFFFLQAFFGNQTMSIQDF